MMEKAAKILVVGHNDIIEKALLEYLLAEGFTNVMSTSQLALDCAIQSTVYDFFQTHRPDYIYLGSTRSGGIQANRERPADFAHHNLQSASNVFYAAHKFAAKKVLYYASSCVYPREAPQPMRPEQILTGPLEPTSQPYALAKLSGMALARGFRRQYGLKTVVMIPATVYGPGVEESRENSHVIGALIPKFVEAVRLQQKSVTVWGSGTPRREFLYRDDFCAASRLLMEQYEGEDVVNVGAGEDVSIAELAGMIARAAGFEGEIELDASKPDGAPRKLLDIQTILEMGWRSATALPVGIQHTVNWYKKEVAA
ncbi:MAG: NAD-dependent epimerase/dehydratase family protein [Candidatus Omnitrophica bacterium]|nr:NAD-dependent epimerase/dehydratase family protein [Candidatus Omnitrophota bacterium]